MNILRADVLGFCMGVKNAVEKTFCEAEKNKGSRVYTLGPLVHNPAVLENLKARGIDMLAEIPENLKDAVVIIRAHGISPFLEEELCTKGARIVDATCPKVKKSQIKARQLAEKGYGIFLAGEANHAEIESILGYAQNAPFCITVNNAQEAEKAACCADKSAKTALLGQTTISEEEYTEIANAIKKHFPGLEVIDTICSATKERQQALRELLKKTDAVIVAGGKESANTKRLVAIASAAAHEYGKPCVLAETASDIPEEFFNYETIGLSAGASAPDSVINEIESYLLEKARIDN